MSTIASLPNELLLEVFECYLRSPVDGKNSKRFHGDRRFTLAAVCGRWRAVIFEAPLLWKFVYVDKDSTIPRPLAESNSADPDDIFVRIAIALRCAGNLGIELIIDIPEKPTSYFNENHTDLFSMILRREAPRLTRLSVRGENWNMHLSVLQGLLNQAMPLLRLFSHDVRFDISQQSSFGNLPNVLIPILQYPFCDSDTDLAKVNQWGRELYPNLMWVEISGAPYNFRLLPTRGLRDFGLCNQPRSACPPFSHLREMLSFAADTLKDLWLPAFLHITGESLHVRHIVLPKLENLTLTYDRTPAEVTNFLPWIRTPALKQLKIGDMYMTSATADGALTTDAMLEAVMRYLPLHQVEDLELDMPFKDDIAIPKLDALLVKGEVSRHDVPTTLRFLGVLTSLKKLDLWVADEHILHFLNYPRDPSFGKDGQALRDGAMWVPSRHVAHLPSLEHLNLFGHEPAIHEFIGNRVNATVRERPLHVAINYKVKGTLEEVLQAMSDDPPEESSSR